MSTLTERLTLGPLHNPVRGLLHGTAAFAALAFGLHLWQRTDGGFPVRTTLVICALSQGLLYLTSSLYHSLPWPPLSKRRMQRLDHAMIYVGIAGSITPIVWLGLDDLRREVILVLAWSLAALGVSQKAFLPRVHERASIPFQILTACLVLPAIGPFAERHPGTPVLLMSFGGACFLVGVLCFITERPRLWPRVFSHHEVFHVCTVLGSGAHLALLVRFVSQVG